MFSRVFSTDTVPKDRYELKQSVRYRRARSTGAYDAFDGKTEFEYGFASDSQVSFSVNTGHLDATFAPDDHLLPGEASMTRSTGFVQGLSVECIYRLLSPFKDAIGFGFLFQPHLDFVNPRNGLKLSDGQGCEVRLLFQKNFLDDQLVLVFNTIGNVSSSRYKGEENNNTVYSWNNEFGVSFRFLSNLFAGVELRSQSDHVTHDKGASTDHSTYWAGPAFHYGGRRLWLTLGALGQVYGTPSGKDDQGNDLGNNLYLRSNERWEYTFKLGVPF